MEAPVYLSKSYIFLCYSGVVSAQSAFSIEQKGLVFKVPVEDCYLQ